MYKVVIVGVSLVFCFVGVAALAEWVALTKTHVESLGLHFTMA